MGAAYGVVTHFHGGVGFLAAAHACEQVFYVWFRRYATFVLQGRFRLPAVLGPGLCKDSIAAVVKLHGSLSSLKDDGPTVMIGVSVGQGPGGKKLGILVNGAECVGHFRSDEVVCGAMALGREWRVPLIEEPLDHVHQVCALIRAMPTGIVPEVAPYRELDRIHRSLVLARGLKSIPVQFSFELNILGQRIPVPVPLCLGQDYVSQGSVIDELLCFLDCWGTAPLHADLYNLLGLARSLHHPGPLLDGGGR